MATHKNSCAGAPSHSAGDWHSIDWRKCYREMRRLQARIVKATREGKQGKVRSLQWILTHSFSGKALAIRRVTENRGKNTPGVDGVTWSTSAAKFRAILSLKRRGYNPRPLRRIYIPKSNGKKRPLGIPAMEDRAMQALYLLALEPVSEAIADRRSFGFRPERSTADAIEQCFAQLSRKVSPKWVLEGDILGCFDNISHDWLLNHTPTDRQILRKWLKAGYMEDRQLFATNAGTPQGGIISPVLANLVLDGMDAKLTKAFGKLISVNGNRINRMVNYVRYADDFIITGRSEELLKDEVMPLVEEFMRERGLKLSAEKTRITHINEGFNFLGQNIRKYDGKLLIQPSKANVKTLLKKVREIIKRSGFMNQLTLIKKLNPLIQGWGNYHQHVASKATFVHVDHEIWKALWRWAKRRHPQKGNKWIKQRYFHFVGKRNWIFAASTGEKQPDGRFSLYTLRTMAAIPITRHRLIKLEANPFDPQWESYFEERLNLKMQQSLRGRKKLVGLWLEQDRRCPICRELITLDSGWHVHHIVRRVDGGKDGSTNLIMVHPNCHTQIHANKITVVKPVRVNGLRKA
ncbi:group II intron reverse transcriptase/maturase [Salmonella enterica subsp. enterica serovar Ngili]|nr:group II intron reverse transcriptase/maturase [Salmonella enterica subsp. enterica serovar Ngili]